MEVSPALLFYRVSAIVRTLVSCKYSLGCLIVVFDFTVTHAFPVFFFAFSAFFASRSVSPLVDCFSGFCWFLRWLVVGWIFLPGVLHIVLLL